MENQTDLAFDPRHAAEVHFYEDDEPTPILHMPVGDLRFLED